MDFDSLGACLWRCINIVLLCGNKGSSPMRGARMDEYVRDLGDHAQ